MDHDPETCQWCTLEPDWARPVDVARGLPRPVATIRDWVKTGRVRSDRSTGHVRVDYWQARCLDQRIRIRPGRWKPFSGTARRVT